MTLTLILEGNKLLANIISDRAKSYLCRDKTSLVDTKFCKASVYCSMGMKKCDNEYCVRKMISIVYLVNIVQRQI